MSNKNSLANKKRKRIKFDATSGSISGFLLSSSDSIQLNHSPDNSLDEPETLDKLKPLKNRLSLEFDDSFDLFASKKIAKKELDEVIPPKTVSPCKIKNGISPSKNSNSGSPRGKNKGKQKIVKKSDYFNQLFTIPCPFCFKFEEEIFTHISTNCIKPPSISDSVASKLIEIHSKYWKQRRNLGIPDFTYNEEEVFKPIVSQGQKVQEVSSESSNDCKIPVLKWTSKSRKAKYVLLRQSQPERENKITQKLALILMGAEAEDECDSKEDCPFQTIDKNISSELLSSLLAKGLTFWMKSSLQPDEASEDIYYIKALAPFIAPKVKTSSDAAPLSELHENNDEPEIVNASIFGTKDEILCDLDPCLPPKEPDSVQNSQMKDSCFTEAELSQSIVNNCKELNRVDYFQDTHSRNWEKIFNSSDLSDMTVLFSDGHFLGHSLVFYSYSMKIFRSISSSSGEESGKLLDWKDITSAVGKAFIKYIYSGVTDHFNHLDCSDLESILCMCNKYDEFYLEALIADLMLSRKSSEGSTDECYSKRNLTSPDIFEDIDSSDDLNDACKIIVDRQSVDSFNTSKRKLELSSENLDINDSNKRIKSDSPAICDIENDTSIKNVDTCESLLKHKENTVCNQDDAVSISSEDKISVSSGATMSPGRYEKFVARPLSQCSTLPPLLESPEAGDKLESPTSPLIFPDSPVNNSLKKSRENFDRTYKIEGKEVLLNSIEGRQDGLDNYEKIADNNLYYDHDSFDYNNYINSSWPDMEPDNMKSDFDQPEKENVTSTKNSINKYFDDSLPAELLEDPEILCKTPQSVNKSIKGSPLYQSTPTLPTSSGNNLTTPSPQILVSDKATPMLNYSNIITPELKGELRKYGLKPEMDRKKAKTLLRYIYNSIHPVVSDSNVEYSSALPENDGVLFQAREDILSNVDEPLNISQESKDEKANTSTESILAMDSESTNDQGEYDFESSQEEAFSQDRTSYLNKNDLLQAVSDFIKRDMVLFDSILQYVPIWLSKFHKALKENEIKCTKVDLMDVLDELCITFRNEKKVKEKKRPKR